jgi:hypothetical protein
MFPAYQSGREFDEELIEQLNALPKLQGSKRTTFSPLRLLLRSARAALP